MSKITLHHLVEEAVGKFGDRSALDLRGVEERPSKPYKFRILNLLASEGFFPGRGPGYEDQSIEVAHHNTRASLSFRRHHDDSLSGPYIAQSFVYIPPHIRGIVGRSEGTVLGPVPNPFENELKGVLNNLCNDRDIAVVRTSSKDSGNYDLVKNLGENELDVLLTNTRDFVIFVAEFRRFVRAKQADAIAMYNLGVYNLMSQFDIHK